MTTQCSVDNPCPRCNRRKAWITVVAFSQSVPVHGNANEPVTIGCTDLSGRGYDLILLDDPRGRAVVFPPGAWAVLTRPQVEQLGVALGSSAHGVW